MNAGNALNPGEADFRIKIVYFTGTKLSYASFVIWLVIEGIIHGKCEVWMFHGFEQVTM